jgi:ACS family hexuronate transporter-like MFS transporter
MLTATSLERAEIVQIMRRMTANPPPASPELFIDPAASPTTTPVRSRAWAWWICGLLMLATVVNYMDRQVLSVTAKRIKAEMQLSNEDYGWLETGYGVAFALGQTLLGIVADRANLRWFYPVILALWSLVGFATGLMDTFTGLLACRMSLGLLEGGNWPSGIKTIQRLLPPAERPLGSGILQSGGALGAMLTPIVVGMLLTDAVGSWRLAFQVIGAIGLLWVALWLASVRSGDFHQPAAAVDLATDVASGLDEKEPTFWQIVFSSRFAVVLCVGVCVNLCWHMLRVWQPLFLQEGRGYRESTMLGFNAAFYLAADIGCIATGAIALALQRRGLSLPRARLVVYFACCLLTACATLAAFLPAGPWLMAVLLVVGCGSLGLFPFFYALSQELSQAHQGKVIGVLGTSAWIALSVLHPLFGRYVDSTKSFDLGLALIGWVPLLSCAVLWRFWPTREKVSGTVFQAGP